MTSEPEQAGMEIVPRGPVPQARGWDRVYLWFEYLALFFALPTVLLLRAAPIAFFPLLLLGSGACVAWLWFDQSFDRRQLWNWAGARNELRDILVRFAVLGAALCFLVLWFAPEVWLGFVRQRPGIWALVMVLYPVLSVLPQNVVWRSFLHHRYQGVLEKPWMRIAAGAAAFGYVHILLENWLAVALTVVGGVLFASTYERSRSMLASSMEHALYGCLVFTIGIGRYLVLNGGLR